MEPLSFHEAIDSMDSEIWVDVLNEEMDSLYKNDTWVLVNKTKNHKLVDCKWLYKVKEGSRFKARLGEKGFTQKSGIDYNENFSHVVKHTSIKVMLSLVTVNDLNLSS